MGAVAVGALFVALLLMIAAAMLWQEARRRTSAEPAIYAIDDAARFVHAGLSEAAAFRLAVEDVRRILEWALYQTQVVAPRRGDPPPVFGSGDSLPAIMRRAEEAGFDYDPLDIGEVLAGEGAYLVAIGAVGEAVEEDQQ
jgi:hypothetical protein